MTDKEKDTCLQMIIASNRLCGFLAGSGQAHTWPKNYVVDFEHALEALTDMVAIPEAPK